MAFHTVAERDELADGQVKAVRPDGVPVALTFFEGSYGALAGRCPHAGGPLGEGEIDFGYLVCPWHGREFHPTTGQCQGYEEHLRTYPVEVRDDGIYVDPKG
jgi:nitrite reductase/ring-hydroxylating ferredoxin subunit